MARTLSYYYRLTLLVSLALVGCCLILWSHFSDRSVIHQLWKSYAVEINNSHTTIYSRITTLEHLTTKTATTSLQTQQTLKWNKQPRKTFRTAFTNDRKQSTNSDEQYVRCTPRKNIAFLKTHKCGSSTMQNILLRYGDTHNLTFALPKIGNSAYDHMFTMNRPLKIEFVEDLPVKRYNILCHHCIYNESAFRNTVYDDALIMAVIRSPVRVFESKFSYFGYAKHLNLLKYPNPLLEFMNRAERADPSDRKYVSKRNPMLNAFGLLDNKDNVSMIDSLIENLKSSIEFVVITDHYDESLILLKEKLCWDFDDIVYFPQLVRRDENRNSIDSDLAERIKRWNFGDAKLFEFFNHSLWRKIDEFGRDRMKIELKKFQDRKQFWKEKCTEGASVSRFFISLRAKSGLKEDTTCWQMTRSEIFYTRYLRKKQRLLFNLTKF